MKWSTIFLLSLSGACMGAFSLYGYTANRELVLWTVIALGAAFSVARATSDKVFLHGVLSGMGIGILSATVQVVFFETYVHHNQFAASELRHFSEGFSPQLFLILSSPVVGGFYGLIIGALSIAAAKFHHPK